MSNDIAWGLLVTASAAITAACIIAVLFLRGNDAHGYTQAYLFGIASFGSLTFYILERRIMDR